MAEIVQSRSVSFSTRNNQLAAKLHISEGKIRAGVVVAHGLFSSMASEKLTRLALFLCRSGCRVLQFDHSGCGESTGDIKETTLSSRRDEFLAAVKLIQGQGNEPLVYIGSSMGGTAAAMAADIKPPACSLHWSAPWDYYALMERINAQGDVPDLPFMARDIDSHDLQGLLGRLQNACFIHGESDEVVPVGQARSGYQLAKEPKRIHIISEADHRLSRREDQQSAFEFSLAWINKFIPT